MCVCTIFYSLKKEKSEESYVICAVHRFVLTNDYCTVVKLKYSCPAYIISDWYFVTEKENSSTATLGSKINVLSLCLIHKNVSHFLY
jgi:hypothetical protein